MNTTETSRHEASRAAMEAAYKSFEPNWQYRVPALAFVRGWQAALDHAAQEQPKCRWTADTTTESWDTDCGRDIKILVYDFEGKPGFCPGCGRRVERLGNQQEQPSQTTSDSANTEIVQESDIPAAFFESLAQAERGELEPMFDDEQDQPATTAPQTTVVKCIGRGNENDGCGYVGGKSGDTCPQCGGMILIELPPAPKEGEG